MGEPGLEEQGGLQARAVVCWPRWEEVQNWKKGGAADQNRGSGMIGHRRVYGIFPSVTQIKMKKPFVLVSLALE